MKFLAPDNLKGQEVIYVEGANDGKLIGHAGSGLMALAGTKWLDPKGTLAMIGQRYPITELGIANLVRRLIEVGEHDDAIRRMLRVAERRCEGRRSAVHFVHRDASGQAPRVSCFTLREFLSTRN